MYSMYGKSVWNISLRKTNSKCGSRMLIRPRLTTRAPPTVTKKKTPVGVITSVVTMNTRSEKEKQRQLQEKCQNILSQLLRDDDNKYCVDCDAKGPRWASWNLGIFLCIRCAGIHRNLGVHISKVKSVNLDSWTPEQVASLQQMGNSRARAVYEANLPDNFRRPQTDSSLEAFVRAKYEQKKYIAKEWVPPPPAKSTFDINDIEPKKKNCDKKKSSTRGIELQAPGSIAAPIAKPASTSNASSTKSTPPPESELIKTSVSKSNPSVDLLGLDDVTSSNSSNNDLFGSFLSAETESTAIPAQNEQPITSEVENLSSEENFFNQTDTSKKQQLTKESILSLYGQNSTPQQPMYGIPGVYPQSFPAQNIGATYPNVPMSLPQQPVGVVSPGMIPNASPMQTMPPQVVAMGSGNVVGSNPFFNQALPGFFAPATNMVAPNPAALGQFDSNFVPCTLEPNFGVSDSVLCMSANTATNPFVCNPHEMQLQQQMAALSVDGRQMMAQPSGISWTNQQTGHTLSTNLWQ